MSIFRMRPKIFSTKLNLIAFYSSVTIPMKKWIFPLIFSFAYSLVQADCFDDAAKWQGVHAGILRAIAIQENPRCDATIHTNTNGTVDIGCMQINSIHLSELAKYAITRELLLDPCINIFVGARHYKKMLLKYGNTWAAVGAYHSENPKFQTPYARSVQAIFQRYRLYL